MKMEEKKTYNLFRCLCLLKFKRPKWEKNFYKNFVKTKKVSLLLKSI